MRKFSSVLMSFLCWSESQMQSTCSGVNLMGPNWAAREREDILRSKSDRSSWRLLLLLLRRSFCVAECGGVRQLLLFLLPPPETEDPLRWRLEGPPTGSADATDAEAGLEEMR